MKVQGRDAMASSGTETNCQDNESHPGSSTRAKVKEFGTNELEREEMAQEEALRDGGVMKGLSDELGTVQQALEPLYNHLEEAIELN